MQLVSTRAAAWPYRPEGCPPLVSSWYHCIEGRCSTCSESLQGITRASFLAYAPDHPPNETRKVLPKGTSAPPSLRSGGVLATWDHVSVTASRM